MKLKIRFCLFFCIAFVFPAGKSFAQNQSRDNNTLAGPAGYIVIPSARPLPPRDINASSWFDSENNTVMNVTAGIGKGAAAGVNEEIPEEGETKTSLNINWNILEGNNLLPWFSWVMADRWNYFTATFELTSPLNASCSLCAATKDFEGYFAQGGLNILLKREWYIICDYDGYIIRAGIHMPYIGVLGATLNSDPGSEAYFWGYTLKTGI